MKTATRPSTLQFLAFSTPGESAARIAQILQSVVTMHGPHVRVDPAFVNLRDLIDFAKTQVEAERAAAVKEKYLNDRRELNAKARKWAAIVDVLRAVKDSNEKKWK